MRYAKRHTRHRRSARVGTTVLLIVVTLAAGVAGGYWIPRRLGFAPSHVGGTGPADAGLSGAGAAEQWYTCGMHPNVLQKGPGDCPICQMKLTPLKSDDATADAVASKERKVLYWRAPMDPNYISQKPGKSPMGMDLVPVYADEDESASAQNIRIDPVTIQNMGIRTAAIRRGPLVKTVRTVGWVDYDEQLVTFIDTKFNGWIEKLYVDETGQRVDEGQALFDVYSPELYGAQQEYISAVQNLPRLEKSTMQSAREDAAKMVEAAVTKLNYLDVSDEQIATLRETGKIAKTMSIHSPASGIVTEKMALEGMYVKPGMRLYTIADLSRVWVYVDVYEYQLPWIRTGQAASMTLPYVPGKQFSGRVVYIYPYLDVQTRVIKVRLEFENPSLELKPGMYANVTLDSELQRDAVLIPREAYIDTGTRQLAFVDLGHGKFAPRDIQVGVEAEDGLVEVLYGLDEGEVVVTSGQFMLDAESKLKEAVAKMMEAERAKTTKRTPTSHVDTARTADRDDASAEQTPSGMPPDATYACPMEKHPDENDPADQGPYFSESQGKCPRCGMRLKPIDELDWVKVRRASEGGDVAYTCPDHQHVLSRETGQCPRCGKELTPFKVMYTCPDPKHANVISKFTDNCPHCGRGMAAFRGVWLDPSMAAQNIPDDPALADVAAYRCPLHPLVHSDAPGRCTVCGQKMESDLKTASTVEPTPAADAHFVCPMHPRQAQSTQPGTCPVCGMRMVNASELRRPTAASEHVAAQMDYILEHYLELQKQLAADRTTDVARQALGLVSAAEELMRHVHDPNVNLPAEAVDAARQLHKTALKTTGVSLAADRVTFVQLSAAVRTLVEHARPDAQRWPQLYIYHCPMSKGDWIQATEEKNNPYYGFKMLRCGELQGIK